LTRRSKIWLAGDALFILGNVAGGIVAMAQGEMNHASGHLILVAIGIAVAWLLVPKSPTLIASPVELSDGLTRLQQSLDAVAIEVERISEGQRYVTRLFDERGNVGAEAGENLHANKSEQRRELSEPGREPGGTAK
jgi:hypothetical protein